MERDSGRRECGEYSCRKRTVKNWERILDSREREKGGGGGGRHRYKNRERETERKNDAVPEEEKDRQRDIKERIEERKENNRERNILYQLLSTLHTNVASKCGYVFISSNKMIEVANKIDTETKPFAPRKDIMHLFIILPCFFPFHSFKQSKTQAWWILRTRERKREKGRERQTQRQTD